MRLPKQLCTRLRCKSVKSCMHGIQTVARPCSRGLRRIDCLKYIVQYNDSSKGWVKSWQLCRICGGSVADFVADLWRILCRIWRRILTLALTLAPASLIPRQSDEIALKYNLWRATKSR